jgi:hypothetical protein
MLSHWKVCEVILMLLLLLLLCWVCLLLSVPWAST